MKFYITLSFLPELDMVFHQSNRLSFLKQLSTTIFDTQLSLPVVNTNDIKFPSRTQVRPLYVLVEENQTTKRVDSFTNVPPKLWGI